MTGSTWTRAGIRWWVCEGCGQTWAWPLGYDPLRDAYGNVVCEQCHADPPERLG